MILFTRIFMLLFLYKEITCDLKVEVDENFSVTIHCPLSGNIQYPTWTSPEGLANPLTVGQTIKEPGFEWVNNKDLKIEKALLKHDGNYTCNGNDGNTGMVELDVQYFSPSASITTASTKNTTAVFICEVHSNPRSKIVPHTISHVTLGDASNKTASHTTFYPCEPDPSRENRTKCSVVTIMHVSKEINGEQMKCNFEYKNQTRATLFSKVQFQFPPTRVTITGNKPITNSEQKKLNLTCSTDASNPVSALVWRKGKENIASQNTVIHSTRPSITMDAEFNGQNITQDIDIDVDETTNKEKVFCCAEHIYKELCTSVILNYNVSSACSEVSKLLTQFLVALALLHLVWMRT